jgi:hypothetical protein
VGISNHQRLHCRKEKEEGFDLMVRACQQRFENAGFLCLMSALGQKRLFRPIPKDVRSTPDNGSSPLDV